MFRRRGLKPLNLESVPSLATAGGGGGLNQSIFDQLIFNQVAAVNIDKIETIAQLLVFNQQVFIEPHINQTLIFIQNSEVERLIQQTLAIVDTIDHAAVFNRSIVQMLDFSQDTNGFSTRPIDQISVFIDQAKAERYIPIMRKKLKYSKHYMFGYYRLNQSYSRTILAEVYDIIRETVVIRAEY